MSESTQQQTNAEWQADTVKWLEDMEPHNRDFVHGHILRLKLKEIAERRDAGVA